MKIIGSGLYQALGPNTNLQEIQGTEKHIKLHHKHIISKIQTVGKLYGQTTQFLQQINCTLKKRIRGGPIDLNRLIRTINQLQNADSDSNKL